MSINQANALLISRSLNLDEMSDGFLNSVWSSEAGQKAWGWWDSVKSSAAVKEANERLQQAQKQAQEAWDAEAIKDKLVQLGHTATEYIDSADRKLEEFENKTADYLQQEGAKIAEKVMPPDEQPATAEVLFNGPEKKPVSRLDAELMALNASPDRFLEKLDGKAAQVSAAEQKSLLAASADLAETHRALVPSKFSDAEFWNQYSLLRQRLIIQDERRKQLIERQGNADEEEDGWGSSDDEAAESTLPKRDAAVDEDEDDDWE